MAYIELSEADAHARLTDMTAATCNPELSDLDVERLLVYAKVPDKYGITPDIDGWTPTWDLDVAAAHGWRIKAGRAASSTGFSADGASYSLDQLIANCEKMASMYEARAFHGVSYVTSDVDDALGSL